MENIEIRKSVIEGNGIFAVCDIKKGSRVYAYSVGKIINSSDILKLSESDKRYLDRIGDDRFEIIESPARYVNHSCSPNIIEKDRIAYALKDIKKDEEITIDYDQVAYLDKPFKCNCDSNDCRGFIDGKK